MKDIMVDLETMDNVPSAAIVAIGAVQCDLTTGETVFIAKAKNSADKIGLEFVDFLSSEEGIPLYKDHEYTLISLYNNRSDEKQDAMASMFIYMLDRDFEEASESPRI